MSEQRQIKGDDGITSAFAGALPALSILLGLLAITSALQRSAAVGRLSFPPAYDDVGYFVSGYDVYASFLANGLSASALLLLHDHAPLQSILAMIGDFLFGLGPWSAYLANGFLVVGLVLVLLVFTRPLQPIARFAIIAYVISLPLTGNLVTEFRPDFYWGLLCGIAVYLMLNREFLRGSPINTYAPAIFVAFAVLAKPSASPATAALLGIAALFAIWLQRPLRARLPNLGKFVLVTSVIAGPYFATNATAIYDYIHQAMVEQYDVNKLDAPFWTQALYYSTGGPGPFTLSTALWVGILLFIWNLAFLCLSRSREDLIRYCCFGLVVLVAYIIPTASPVKTPFLGSIFYGTFLFFMVRGLILAFAQFGHLVQPKARRSILISAAGPAVLILFTLTTFHGWRLLSTEPKNIAGEWTQASHQLTTALEKEVTAVDLQRPAIVFITAAYPVSSTNVSLASRWDGIQMEGDGGYYIRSLKEGEEHARRADFVLISQKYMGPYPGSELGLSLLQRIRDSGDFALVTDFAFSDGLKAYLFRRLSFATSGESGDWIASSGLILKGETSDLAKRPFLILDGRANYDLLGGRPNPRAALLTAPGTPEIELPAILQAKDSAYRIVIDGRAVPMRPNSQYSIRLTFDRYFVPKERGINNDTRELVVGAPRALAMRSSPPTD